jgi:hypothetical protein
LRLFTGCNSNGLHAEANHEEDQQRVSHALIVPSNE